MVSFIISLTIEPVRVRKKRTEVRLLQFSEIFKLIRKIYLNFITYYHLNFLCTFEVNFDVDDNRVKTEK